MRTLIIVVAVVASFAAQPSFAQSEQEMQLQRCIWGCLSRSKGNEDPAYHACVVEVCTGTESPTGNAANPWQFDSKQSPSRASAWTMAEDGVSELRIGCNELLGPIVAGALYGIRAMR